MTDVFDSACDVCIVTTGVVGELFMDELAAV